MIAHDIAQWKLGIVWPIYMCGERKKQRRWMRNNSQINTWKIITKLHVEFRFFVFAFVSFRECVNRVGFFFGFDFSGYSIDIQFTLKDIVCVHACVCIFELSTRDRCKCDDDGGFLHICIVHTFSRTFLRLMASKHTDFPPKIFVDGAILLVWLWSVNVIASCLLRLYMLFISALQTKCLFILARCVCLNVRLYKYVRFNKYVHERKRKNEWVWGRAWQSRESEREKIECGSMSVQLCIVYVAFNVHLVLSYSIFV